LDESSAFDEGHGADDGHGLVLVRTGDPIPTAAQILVPHRIVAARWRVGDPIPTAAQILVPHRIVAARWRVGEKTVSNLKQNCSINTVVISA
jgi:hypothetical protein